MGVERFTVLVTGSSRGIGFALADEFLSRGHDVVMHGSDPARLKKAQESLEDRHERPVEAFAADLLEYGSYKGLARAVEACQQHPILLVNNAGLYLTADDITREGFGGGESVARCIASSRMLEVNGMAPKTLTELLSPSRTLLMSSTATIIHYDDDIGYRNSKRYAELESLISGLHGVYAKRANLGLVETDMTKRWQGARMEDAGTVARELVDFALDDVSTDLMIHPAPAETVRARFALSYGLVRNIDELLEDYTHDKACSFGRALQRIGAGPLAPELLAELDRPLI